MEAPPVRTLKPHTPITMNPNTHPLTCKPGCTIPRSMLAISFLASLVILIILGGCVAAHAGDAPPPSAIDFSTFTPDTLDAYFRGLRAKNAIVREQLTAAEASKAVLEGQLQTSRGEVDKIRAANEVLTRSTAKLQTAVDDMREWGIGQQKRADEAEAAEKIAQDRAYRREWFIGVLAGVLSLICAVKRFPTGPWWIWLIGFAAGTAGAVTLVHLYL